MNINVKDIDLIVYDFDGVLTDNKVYVFEDGKEAAICNRSDGYALEKIKEYGVPQVILSAETNDIVRRRAEKLNIGALTGVRDKKCTLTEYCDKNNFTLNRVLYVGNDINDLEVMKTVGYALAPSDANEKIKQIAHTIVPKKGGEGVVKEIFDNLLTFG